MNMLSHRHGKLLVGLLVMTILVIRPLSHLDLSQTLIPSLELLPSDLEDVVDAAYRALLGGEMENNNTKNNNDEIITTADKTATENTPETTKSYTNIIAEYAADIAKEATAAVMMTTTTPDDDTSTNNSEDRHQEPPEQRDSTGMENAGESNEFLACQFRTVQNTTTSHYHVQECCGRWKGRSSDDWWTHHPTWVRGTENATHYCLQDLPRGPHRQYLQHVYDLQQWDRPAGTNCTNLTKSVEVNSGFGHVLSWLTGTFMHAIHDVKGPFAVIYTERRWLYSISAHQHYNISQSWAYCDTEDTQCYYLPVSNCDRSENLTIRHEHYDRKPHNDQEKLQYYWLRNYLFRPNQVLRYQIMTRKLTVPLELPCTTMHVRRADAGFPRPPFRRYAAVQEYLDVLPHNIDSVAFRESATHNILLLTDDTSTLTEVQRHFIAKNATSMPPNYQPPYEYNWVYLKKIRNTGIDNGFGDHIPKGSDEAAELVAIYTELELAKECSQLVHGQSGFMKSLQEDLANEGKREGIDVHHYIVDTTVSRASAQVYGQMGDNGKYKRVEDFLRNIEMIYEQKYSNWTASHSDAGKNEDGNVSDNKARRLSRHPNRTGV